MNNWKKNIKLSVKVKIWIRDNIFLKCLYNPIQVFRRRNGLADKDIFKHIIIQTNYNCTRKCTFCHYGIEKPPKNIDMEEKLFCCIIDQLRDINYKGRMGHCGINEPLTDKRFEKFLQYTRKKLSKEWIFLSSNGDLLNSKRAEQLFEDGLNFIYLSSYDEIALERISKLMKEIKPKYKKLINHLNRTYQTQWINRGGNIRQFKSDTIFAPCDFVYEILYIKPSGKVYSCFNDFYNINEMGDLNKEKILDVWFGDKFMKLRKQLNSKNRNSNELCKHCDHRGYEHLPRIPLRWRLKYLLKWGERQ